MQLVEEDPGIIREAIAGAGGVGDETIDEEDEGALEIAAEDELCEGGNAAHLSGGVCDDVAVAEEEEAGFELIVLAATAFPFDAAEGDAEHAGDELDPLDVTADPVELFCDAAGDIGCDAKTSS